MNLSDFSTLAEAQAHSYIQYSGISSSKGSQYFSLMGVLDSIEANQTNDTVIQVLPSLPPTTIGMMCKVIIKTIDKSNDGFVVDPNTQAGVLNRAAGQFFVSEGVMSQVILDGFFAQSESVITPFANSTKHDFDKAKGTINKTLVTVENGYCTITTTADTESHSPQIYREVAFSNGDVEYIRVAGFSAVSTAALYRVQCPSFPVMRIDDAYSVITQG